MARCTVDGVGYVGVRPSSRNKCYYENIKDAHFSYDRKDFCEGHAPHFEVNKEERGKITLTHVPFRRHRTYNFEQLHIHVGKKRRKGSEHSINSKFYPMEAHLVFYDRRYKNITYAKFRPEGLVVLSVMIKVQHENDNDKEEEDEQGHIRDHKD
ncbi:nacrein-like protein, partial [Saccostrea cucullata]|uniref:nacrein-like protein n=1 Tax=Saccostrea cuccullata TaxID=36930 RepID=UPI002ED3F8A2